MPLRSEFMPVANIIRPRSVAVIGATEDYVKFGGRFTHHLVELGFKGRFIPVNPRRAEVLGHKAFPSILELDEMPDLALVAVPSGMLLQTVDECGRAGVGACIVVTAQLSEFSEEGAALEREIVALARSYNMRLVGPNCMGLIVPPHGMGLTSSQTLRYAGKLNSGSVALVSQSGALMGSLFAVANDHGVGLSGMVTVGNQADMEMCDFLEAFIADEDTRVVCLYVEGVRSPERFRKLAREARTRGKTILAVKAGATEAGTAMARSHTGSIAGSYTAFETACRENGVVILDDAEAMILCANIIAQNPPMGAGATGIVVSSGGGGAVLIDRLTDKGVPLARWTEATHQRLDPDYGSGHRNNPIDLGAHKGKLDISVFRRAIEAVCEDPGVSAFFYMMTPQPLMPETIDIVLDMHRRGDKPVVFCLNTSRFGDDVRQKLLEAKMPFVSRNDDAARALKAMFQARDFAETGPKEAPQRPAGTGGTKAGRSGLLTEPEVKEMLAAYGVKQPAARTARTREEAVAAAREIGYPVVLKGVAEGVVHKSDLGLVKVDLADEAALHAALAEVSAVFEREKLGSPLFDVQQMVQGGVELIVGVQNDASFGPQLMVGFGGIFVEILRDVAFASAPVSPAQAEAMLKRLKMWPLLEGVRGRPAMDVAASCDAIARISWLAADLGDRLVDIEVNPLKVTPDGAWAVDGRATLSGTGEVG